MLNELLLTMEPPAPVRSMAELYAIAFDQAHNATQRYGALAAGPGEAVGRVRRVFEVLTLRERDRAKSVADACVAICNKRPDLNDLCWTPIDLVPAEEVADIGDSVLSTPYDAWALAVRHRQRAFVFWTYVSALAGNAGVRAAAENLAREALFDGNLLRRERRLAWRAERQLTADDATTRTENEIASAALLESLLREDIIAWSQKLPSEARDHLLALAQQAPPLRTLAPSVDSVAAPELAPIDQVERRALRRAEQLSKIYLDEADRADDQTSMELAQNLAAHSIMRLAALRTIASVHQRNNSEVHGDAGAPRAGRH